MGCKERGKLYSGDLVNEEKEMKEKKMNEKEEELNGMRGDRKTEPALRCQLTPQIHSNPPPPLATTSSALVCTPPATLVAQEHYALVLTVHTLATHFHNMYIDSSLRCCARQH